MLSTSGYLTRLRGKSRFMGPEAEAGVGDKEYLLAVDGVPAVGEGVGVVAFHHLRKVGPGESDALDLFAGQFAGAPGDFEAAL